MDPNTFLNSFWRNDIEPQVFVAMSFDDIYTNRFREVFEPAIQSVAFGKRMLRAIRTDLTKSGDSILTQINDGIAHSVLILADVSVVGRDSTSGKAYRNANVMYEVGIALTCRSPLEVILVRDDSDSLLFDLSTIPHDKIDFTNISAAREKISFALKDRLTQINYMKDLRVQQAVRVIRKFEYILLKNFVALPKGRAFNDDIVKQGLLYMSPALTNLLSLGLVQTVGRDESSDSLYYEITDFGRAVFSRLTDANMPIFKKPLDTNES